MRFVFLLIFILLSGFCIKKTDASAGYEDLEKLAKKGADEEIMLAYIESTNIPYHLTVDEISYLKDIGVSSKIIAAVLNQGKKNREDSVKKPENQQHIEQNDFQRAELSGPALPVVPEKDKADISYFYEMLLLYGEWILLNNKWYWRPYVSLRDPEWRPYSDSGKWVYTDYGWTWLSDYSWGWAPFHYGRWKHFAEQGWLWTPDTSWGPAWVYWRCNDDFIGWAPLPPEASFEEDKGLFYNGKPGGSDSDFGLGPEEFIFVYSGDFLKKTLPHFYIKKTELMSIYNKTVPVKNNMEIHKKSVFNHGPGFNFVSKVSRQQIPMIHITDVKTKEGEPVPSNTLTNYKLELFRPKIMKTISENPPELIEKFRQGKSKHIVTGASYAKKTRKLKMKLRREGRLNELDPVPYFSDEKSAPGQGVAEKKSSENFLKTPEISETKTQQAQGRRSVKNINREISGKESRYTVQKKTLSYPPAALKSDSAEE